MTDWNECGQSTSGKQLNPEDWIGLSGV